MSPSKPSSSIPCADPKAQYLRHRERIGAAIERVLESGWYILGQELESFEQEFAAYLGADHCIGVANGTDAIALALRAAGVVPGNEVITVSHSAVATVAAIEQIGAIPVFCDIHPDTLCLDPAKLPALISARTKAVVAVHIYGQPADMPSLQGICKKHALMLVEDCAQAHGAAIDERKVGTFGDVAAFSFYPTKNLGALGDGGAVVSNLSEIADRARLLRQYGWKERYISDIAGVNSRLDELQAAILRAKLPHLDQDNARRREIANAYSHALRAGTASVPLARERDTHAMHLYVVRTPLREQLKQHLAERGIGTALHYPTPIHAQPAYRGRIRGSDALSVTDRIYSEILSLPMYPELTDGEVQQVVAALESWKPEKGE